MPDLPTVIQVQYMGEAFPLTLRRVPRARHILFTWQLAHPDSCEGGCSMMTGRVPVPDAETAERQARNYLRRSRPYGRLNPHGESDMARMVEIVGRRYLLLLRTAQFGRFYWALYTLDGYPSIIGADTVTKLDSAERLARAFKGEI